MAENQKQRPVENIVLSNENQALTEADYNKMAEDLADLNDAKGDLEFYRQQGFTGRSLYEILAGHLNIALKPRD